jgi:hypothetical protein
MRFTVCAVALAGSIGLLSPAQVPARAQTVSERNANSGLDRDIVFPDKAFVNDKAFVALHGTLTADWLAYPNNTYSILCMPSNVLWPALSK